DRVGLQDGDQPGGMPGMLRVGRPGDGGRVGLAAGVGVAGEPTLGGPEQDRPQLGGILGQLGVLLGELGGESRDLGAVGSIGLPGDVDGALDEVVLDGVAGGELVDPGLEPTLIDLGVLAGEDRQPGAAAVLDGVEPRPSLALGGAGPGAPEAIPAIDLGAVDGG